MKKVNRFKFSVQQSINIPSSVITKGSEIEYTPEMKLSFEDLRQMKILSKSFLSYSQKQINHISSESTLFKFYFLFAV